MQSASSSTKSSAAGKPSGVVGNAIAADPNIAILQRLLSSGRLSAEARARAEAKLEILQRTRADLVESVIDMDRALQQQKPRGLNLKLIPYDIQTCKSHSEELYYKILANPVIPFASYLNVDGMHEVHMSKDGRFLTMELSSGIDDPDQQYELALDSVIALSVFKKRPSDDILFRICLASDFTVKRKGPYLNFDASSCVPISKQPKPFQLVHLYDAVFGGNHTSVREISTVCFPTSGLLESVEQQALNNKREQKRISALGGGGGHQPNGAGSMLALTQASSSSSHSHYGELPGAVADVRLDFKERSRVIAKAIRTHMHENVAYHPMYPYIDYQRTVFFSLSKLQRVGSLRDDETDVLDSDFAVTIRDTEWAPNVRREYSATVDSSSRGPFSTWLSFEARRELAFTHFREDEERGLVGETSAVLVNVRLRDTQVYGAFGIYNPEIGEFLLPLMLRSADIMVRGWIDLGRTHNSCCNRADAQYTNGSMRVHALVMGVHDIHVDALRAIRTTGREVTAEYAIQAMQNYARKLGVDFTEAELENPHDISMSEINRRNLPKMMHVVRENHFSQTHHNQLYNCMENLDTWKVGRSGDQFRFYSVSTATFDPSMDRAYHGVVQRLFYTASPDISNLPEDHSLVVHRRRVQELHDKLVLDYTNALRLGKKENVPPRPNVPAAIFHDMDQIEVIYAVSRSLDPFSESVYEWDTLLRDRRPANSADVPQMASPPASAHRGAISGTQGHPATTAISDHAVNSFDLKSEGSTQAHGKRKAPPLATHAPSHAMQKARTADVSEDKKSSVVVRPMELEDEEAIYEEAALNGWP